MSSNQLIGVGLRHPHYHEVLSTRPGIGWFEVHSENFFHQGGPAIDILLKVRENYPISLHGVGLSLGSASGVSEQHLAHLKSLIKKVNPFLVSEHLSWSMVSGVYLPDLLPVPYNDESLRIFTENISKTQDFLGREILIENPSSYLEYKASVQEEVEFLVELTKRSGAKLLLDVNNIFVSCENHGWDAEKYIQSVPLGIVKEIHLAGHSIKEIEHGQNVRIDTHDNVVCDAVWDLYASAIGRFGGVPTLLEWDANIPSLDFLIREAYKAAQYLDARLYATA